MNNNRIYKHNLNIRLKDKQFKNLDNICKEVEVSKAEFIRTALDEKIESYSIEAK